MLGDRLKKLRGNISQEEVAESIGISRARYSHYETERSQPDFETLKNLSDYFGVTIDYLVTGENGQAPSSDEFWKEILDPDTRLFFKDLYEAPEESIRELKEIWEVIKKRRENK